MIEIGMVIVIAAVLGIAILAILYAQHRMYEARKLVTRADEKWKVTQEKIDAERRDAAIKLKDERHKRRNEFEEAEKRRKLELDRRENKLAMRTETLSKRETQVEELKQELQLKERNILRAEDRVQATETKLKNLHEDLVGRLERIGNITRDEARKMLLEMLQSEVALANQKYIQKIEEEARSRAKEQASEIVITAMQRYTAENVATHTSNVVHLPNDEMKGRIIGKEGRNIKSLEMATGMEFVIGDTPEIITISGFNPIRREVARRSLEKLVLDGRINPTRIEETVAQVEREVDEIIQEQGRESVLQFNLQGVHADIVTLLGKLNFRTSFSQNVLTHCKEVGIFARMIASELGLDDTVALRAGLLHDIGKAMTAEVEGPHAIIGGEVAKRCGESLDIVNAISAHHEETPFTSIYAPLVVIADIVSASRPGARRETLSAYVKRLEQLEEIALSFEGVKKAYALQAGREVRIIVEEDRLDDEQARMLARDIARKVEQEMNFPGQIKINVIREKRSIEYAR